MWARGASRAAALLSRGGYKCAVAAGGLALSAYVLNESQSIRAAEDNHIFVINGCAPRPARPPSPHPTRPGPRPRSAGATYAARDDSQLLHGDA